MIESEATCHIFLSKTLLHVRVLSLSAFPLSRFGLSKTSVPLFIKVFFNDSHLLVGGLGHRDGWDVPEGGCRQEREAGAPGVHQGHAGPSCHIQDS